MSDITQLSGNWIVALGQIEESQPGEVDWLKLFIDPNGEVTRIWRDVGAGYLPPTLPETGPSLAKKIQKSLVQRAIFFEDWASVDLGTAPDPSLYGSKSQSNIIIPMQPAGPLIIKIVEPTWALTPDGKILVQTTEWLDATQVFDKGFPATGFPFQPAPVPNLAAVKGGRRLYYSIPVDVIKAFLKDTPDGPLPVPTGYPNKWPNMPGDVVGIHLLNQLSEVTFGIFDVAFPSPEGFTNLQQDSNTLYGAYLGNVMPAWKRINDYMNAAKLNMWNNFCVVALGNNPEGLIYNDPFPSPTLVLVSLFSSGLASITVKAASVSFPVFYAGALDVWFRKHPEYGPNADPKSMDAYWYTNFAKPFITSLEPK